MKINAINKKISKLEELTTEIEENGIHVMRNVSLTCENPGFCKWGVPSDEIKLIQRKAIKSYQNWYSGAMILVKEYLPERVTEFTSNYEVLSFLQLKRSRITSNKDEPVNEFIDVFDTQRGILLSIPDVIEVKEMNLRKLISADFVESELDEVEILFKHKYIRCAGALAGVALEKHLVILCQINNVPYDHKDTINPLATNLYSNNVLDISELKKIEHLGSIRNKCDHPKDIKKLEVRELIDETKKFINNH